MNSERLICSFYTAGGVLPRGAHDASTPSPHSFEDRVKACAEAGYIGMGFHFSDYAHVRNTGVSDADMRSILREHGMEYIELEFLQDWFMEGSRQAASRQNEEVIYEAARGLGAQHFNVGGDFEGKDWSVDVLISEFRDLCRRAAQHDLRVALEIMPWTNIKTVENGLTVVNGADASNGGLLLDSWHVFRGSITYDEMRQIPANRVVAVQIDDAKREIEGSLFEDTIYNRELCGEGDIDLNGYVATLADMGVNVPFGVEIISIKQSKKSVTSAATESYRAARCVVDAALPSRSPR